MDYDYHIHCLCSPDCQAPVSAQLEAARKGGLTHICFTDHADFDGYNASPGDFAARNAQITRTADRFPDLDVRMGVELGMGDLAYLPQANAFLSSLTPLDFIIGSVHFVDGMDVYSRAYFQGREREECYTHYVERIAALVRLWPFSVLGHYDFCAKPAPYANRAFRYADAPEQFDRIFRALIEQGKGMEVNASAWRDDPAWGLDVLTRYRELGGEFVTLGSDAHQPQSVGRRLHEARELARAAGIPYVATYKNLKPAFHRI